MLRYLKTLPEPVVPLDHYQSFVTSLYPPAMNLLDGDELHEYKINEDELREAANTANSLMKKLPTLNRQLLFYLLDVIAAVSRHSAKNRRFVGRIVAAFQPSLLSGPLGTMDTENYNIAAQTVILCVFVWKTCWFSS